LGRRFLSWRSPKPSQSLSVFRCRLEGERLTPVETGRDRAWRLTWMGSCTSFRSPAPATKTVERISAEIRQGVERLSQRSSVAANTAGVVDRHESRRVQRRGLYLRSSTRPSRRFSASAASRRLPSCASRWADRASSSAARSRCASITASAAKIRGRLSRGNRQGNRVLLSGETMHD